MENNTKKKQQQHTNECQGCNRNYGGGARGEVLKIELPGNYRPNNIENQYKIVGRPGNYAFTNY